MFFHVIPNNKYSPSRERERRAALPIFGNGA
jgi:hypothetical protein